MTAEVHCSGIPSGSVVKNPPADAGDTRDLGSIPGLRRSPGEGRGNPLQYSCLGNPMDRGAWWAIVHTIAKSQTRLSEHTHEHNGNKLQQIRKYAQGILLNVKNRLENSTFSRLKTDRWRRGRIFFNSRENLEE